jgi:hypothetical protein
MNCCDDYGHCTQGANCPARAVAGPSFTKAWGEITSGKPIDISVGYFTRESQTPHTEDGAAIHCVENLQIFEAALISAPTDPDEDSPARDVAPDYMSCWEWISQVLQAGLAAAVALAIVCGGLGLAFGRWML